MLSHLAAVGLDPTVAVKTTGRRSFASGIAGNRVVCTFVKPRFAQNYDHPPFLGFRISQ